METETMDPPGWCCEWHAHGGTGDCDDHDTDDGLNHPDHGIATMPGEDRRMETTAFRLGNIVTSVREGWSAEVREEFDRRVGPRMKEGETVTQANYFTPRPYVGPVQPRK